MPVFSVSDWQLYRSQPPRRIGQYYCLAPFYSSAPHQWLLPKCPCIRGSHKCDTLSDSTHGSFTRRFIAMRIDAPSDLAHVVKFNGIFFSPYPGWGENKSSKIFTPSGKGEIFPQRKYSTIRYMYLYSHNISTVHVHYIQLDKHAWSHTCITILTLFLFLPFY